MSFKPRQTELAKSLSLKDILALVKEATDEYLREMKTREAAGRFTLLHVHGKKGIKDAENFSRFTLDALSLNMSTYFSKVDGMTYVSTEVRERQAPYYKDYITHILKRELFDALAPDTLPGNYFNHSLKTLILKKLFPSLDKLEGRTKIRFSRKNCGCHIP